MNKRRADGTGTIYRRKDGRWAAAVDLGWQDGKRRRAYVYGKTEAEVVAKLQALQRQVWSGEPVLTGRETLSEYLESWLADTLPGTVKPSTQRSYTDIARRHIIPELGRIPLRKLTPAHVRRLLHTKSTESSSRGQTLSPRTVQYIHSVLRRALEQARRDELIPRNVAKLVQPPRVPRPERRWLTDDQARQLLDELRQDRLYAVYAVAIATGLRRGEVLGLRWTDVDLDARTVHVRASLQRVDGQLVLVDPKTKMSQRPVPLPEVCVAALREHQARQAQDREQALVWLDEWGLVFTTKHGTPIEPRNLLRHFQATCERIGLPRMRFHELRHTCASLLLAQGVEPRVIMELLGHSMISTTLDVYAHVMPALQRDAADKMDALLRSKNDRNGRGSTPGSQPAHGRDQNGSGEAPPLD